MHHAVRRVFCGFVILGGVSLTTFAADDDTPPQVCVPATQWINPATKKPLNPQTFLRSAAKRRVVLLGEHHDNAEHHRWELHTLTALYTLRPQLALGFEMFPRRVQPVLDRWVAGELSEEEFLKGTDWYNVWSFDPALYMPLFHFARMNHIPMVALNVDRTLIREVNEKGWDAVPEAHREGLTNPSPPNKNYLELLAGSFRAHQPPHTTDKPAAAPDGPAFKRFVQGQTLWDAAMAQGIAARVKGPNAPLFVAIMGSGHMMNRYGVPDQLAALRIKEVTVAIAWETDFECDMLEAGFADVVVGLAATDRNHARARPRLGVFLERVTQGVRISKVGEGSLAAASGLLAEDLVIEVAGTPITQVEEVISAVQRILPGTWLPVVVQRGAERKELLVKFPVEGEKAGGERAP